MSMTPIGSPMLKARIPLPPASVADQTLTTASELGYPHRDIAALHQVLAKAPAQLAQGTTR